MQRVFTEGCCCWWPEGYVAKSGGSLLLVLPAACHGSPRKAQKVLKHMTRCVINEARNRMAMVGPEGHTESWTL